MGGGGLKKEGEKRARRVTVFKWNRADVELEAVENRVMSNNSRN